MSHRGWPAWAAGTLGFCRCHAHLLSLTETVALLSVAAALQKRAETCIGGGKRPGVLCLSRSTRIRASARAGLKWMQLPGAGLLGLPGSVGACTSPGDHGQPENQQHSRSSPKRGDKLSSNLPSPAACGNSQVLKCIGAPTVRPTLLPPAVFFLTVGDLKEVTSLHRHGKGGEGWWSATHGCRRCLLERDRCGRRKAGERQRCCRSGARGAAGPADDVGRRLADLQRPLRLTREARSTMASQRQRSEGGAGLGGLVDVWLDSGDIPEENSVGRGRPGL